ncbi:MAG: tRNA (adenosine(37)-N6)-threonylcarbamoyltransferase complex ATPase subunit type 1 TsaE [Chloroflexi bacterium]|nr:MAG: tRNA (adenosine(37)-N6)-threonylcarbamoyltransferase complex ATPase subunit type 1 TsaE [Chloroflexota bacterium]HDN79221.1 tRNA (adenosine(37)-N6)-threonylcarbamoyltransferase complex ATPase subunit type 1 TsaE [Chloroflexota bacterium]
MSPILNEDSLSFVSRSEEQTRRLGTRLGLLLEKGDIICLEGPLGSGKTCFVQGIGKGMGIKEPITSPSFILISEYHPSPSTPPLYHIDFYRLENPVKEALALGIEEYFYGEGVCVIEWAERAKEIIPPQRMWITFKYVGPTHRHLLMEAQGERYRELLRLFRRSAFGV